MATLSNILGTTFVGAQGPQGPQGPQGEPGVGVPIGGTEGQVLVKSSATDYATEWATPDSGTTTGKAIAMAMVFG